jgi:hypothetical protein
MISNNAIAGTGSNRSGSQKTAASEALTFNDVHSNYWAYRDIRDLVNKEVISGYSKGIFGPDARVTRAEFAKMICLAKKATAYGDSSHFLDVSDNHWAFNYVEGAVKAGYIDGYGDYTFRPDAGITRAEIVKILIKAENFKINRSGSTPLDVKTNHWAYDYIMTAKALGIMKGYSNGRFYPDNGATRAEACRLIEKAVYGEIDADKVADTEAPDIKITSPTSDSSYETNSASISISGTASDTSTLSKITWSNSKGGSGTASGTTNWSVSSIALYPGSNRITVRAEDADYNYATDSITINCTREITQNGTLTGMVTDSSTASSISDVLVSVYSNGSLVTSGSTNSTGYYTLSLAPGTNYSVQYSKSGYDTFTQNAVTITTNVSSIVNAKLMARKYGTFSGDIEETGTVMGLAGVKITVSLNGVKQQETFSTSSGSFIMELPVGIGYSAVCEKVGYKTYTIGSLDISEGANTYSNIKMEAGAI